MAAEVTGDGPDALIDKETSQVRGSPDHQVGRMFYAPNLVSTLTVAQNIALPWRARGLPVDAGYAGFLVDTFALRDLLDAKPDSLSPLQQLHVACVRALAGRPDEVEVFPGADPLAVQAVADLNRVATSVGQPWRWSQYSLRHDAGEDGLPANLDDIAHALPMSGSQVQLIDQAQQILRGLPGPIDVEDPL